MAVNSEPGPDYGKIRVLQLPSNTTIPGPPQVQNNFESDPTVSSQLSLLRRGGSEVELGNLLSLPVAGGVLYVEPVYIRAAGVDGFPLLRKVLVGFGNKVAFRDTLGQALADVFGAAGGGTVTPPGSGGTGGTPSPSPSATGHPDGGAAPRGRDRGGADGVRRRPGRARRGDFAAYGVAQERLNHGARGGRGGRGGAGLPRSDDADRRRRPPRRRASRRHHLTRPAAICPASRPRRKVVADVGATRSPRGGAAR